MSSCSQNVHIRHRQPTATPRKLQPLVSTLPGDDPFSLRSPTNGKKRYHLQERSLREPSQQSSSGGGAIGGDRDAVIADDSRFTNTVTSPTLDILTCDYRGAGSPPAATLRPPTPEASKSALETVEAMTVPLAAPATLGPSGELASTRGRQEKVITRNQGIPREKEDSASGGDIERECKSPVDTWANAQTIEEQGLREMRERHQFLGRMDGKGDIGTDRAGSAEVEGGDLVSTAGCKAIRAEGNAEDGAAGGQRTTGSLLVPIAGDSTKRMNGRAAMAASPYDTVLPMAFPGEAHEASFGAVARGVVLASGSSRFQVSRCGIHPVSVSSVDYSCF